MWKRAVLDWFDHDARLYEQREVQLMLFDLVVFEGIGCGTAGSAYSAIHLKGIWLAGC
jgi:hypothetical protein